MNNNLFKRILTYFIVQGTSFGFSSPFCSHGECKRMYACHTQKVTALYALRHVRFISADSGGVCICDLETNEIFGNELNAPVLSVEAIDSYLAFGRLGGAIRLLGILSISTDFNRGYKLLE